MIFIFKFLLEKPSNFSMLSAILIINMEYNVNIFILYVTANPYCRMLAESSSQLCFLFVYFKHRFFMLCMKRFSSTCLLFLMLS